MGYGVSISTAIPIAIAENEHWLCARVYTKHFRFINPLKLNNPMRKVFFF
jgi:hypothetical protein